MESIRFIADMHTHTVASTHAYSTITENAQWASEHGIKYLGMTDHGIKMQDAPDTWHFENLKIIPDFLKGVRVFKGIEANILDTNGTLDIPENVKDIYYDILEWVNVSFHIQTFTPTTKEEHTQALINVLKNPYVDVISHPESPKFDIDFNEAAKACAEAGRLIELNECRLGRGEIYRERAKKLLGSCVRYGTSIIVGSDAHFYTHIGSFDNAVKLLHDIGFPQELIINADEDRFLNYIKTRNERIKHNV
ncbi:MAG: phosphatase [Ruminiclostridium sp.]|nr:phosphatase [Ruminiclostridium sp.]